MSPFQGRWRLFTDLDSSWVFNTYLLFCPYIIPKHIAVCISNLRNTIIEVRKRDMVHHLAVVWRVELNLHAVR